jgi:hypothetical protein
MGRKRRGKSISTMSGRPLATAGTMQSRWAWGRDMEEEGRVFFETNGEE